jgi:hypothetical protein
MPTKRNAASGLNADGEMIEGRCETLDLTEHPRMQELVGVVAASATSQVRVYRDGSLILLRTWLADRKGLFYATARSPNVPVGKIDELCAALISAKEAS